MRPAFHLPLALTLAVLVRVPFWIEALRTPLDGDTAIIGLMARHPLADTAMWGQPYGSPLDAWLAAPVFAVLGSSQESLRLLYFLLGLGLVPVGYLLARQLHPEAGLPAAILLACPPPYFLLLSALPPPLYASSLLLGGLILVLTLRAGEALRAGALPRRELVLAGLLAGLALWTHLMLGSVVLACLVYLLASGRRRLAALAWTLPPLLLASAPVWWRGLSDPQGVRVVAISSRSETMIEHVRGVVSSLHRPLGGLLGTHVPLIPDDSEHLVFAPSWVAAGLVLVYGLCAVTAVRRCRRSSGVRLLLGVAALSVLAFPLPLRSGPAAIRFLTPLYLPLAAVVAWLPWGSAKAIPARASRRALVVVLALGCLHLVGGRRLLASWRNADRAEAPFLCPDLNPVRHALEERGIRHAYASYGPAYRLTFESGERIVVSQPWNERFRHYRLPYLDEVRFAKNVAWVLTPGIPTDLPPPYAFEAALGAAGGRWRRLDVAPAAIYHDFEPPFSSSVTSIPGAGPVSDGRLETSVRPPVGLPYEVAFPGPIALDGLTLVAPPGEPRLLRSMDVLVSSDGVAFDVVAERRRRGERADLRWVGGHPQYVLDHDLIAVALHGRVVSALRIAPVRSLDPWALAEVLLHPAVEASRRQPWDEWLDPGLSWEQRRAHLEANPRPGREDWYYRSLLAVRHHDGP